MSARAEEKRREKMLVQKETDLSMWMSKVIRSRRKYLGLSLEDLGKRVGLSSVKMSSVENGNMKMLPYSCIKNLAEALKTSPAYLMGWTDSPGEVFYLKRDELAKMKQEITDKACDVATARVLDSIALALHDKEEFTNKQILSVLQAADNTLDSIALGYTSYSELHEIVLNECGIDIDKRRGKSDQ